MSSQQISNALKLALEQVQLFNGTESLDNDQDQFGYLKKEKNLKIPRSIYDKLVKSIPRGLNNIYQKEDLVDLPQMLTAMEMFAIAILNMDCFTIEAEYNSMLRAHLLNRGFFTNGIKNRFVFLDEYTIVDQEIGEIIDGKSDDYYAKLGIASGRVVKTWRHVVCMVYYTFKQTGHHYIDSDIYNKKYERMIKSAHFDEADIPESYEDTFRTMIHPFGVRVLYDAVHYFCRSNLIDNAFFIRWNTSPCGTSAVISTAAVFDTMIPLPWYSTFYAALKDQIDALYKARTFIREQDIKCHLMARLFGYSKPYLEELNKIGRLLAPYAKAFTALYCGNTPLNESMAIKKWAEQNPGIMSLFTKLLNYYDKEITTSEKLLQAFKSTVGSIAIDYDDLDKIVFGDVKTLANVRYYIEPQTLAVRHIPRLLIGFSSEDDRKTEDINEQNLDEVSNALVSEELKVKIRTKLTNKTFVTNVETHDFHGAKIDKSISEYIVDYFDDETMIINNDKLLVGDNETIDNTILFVTFLLNNNVTIGQLTVDENYEIDNIGITIENAILIILNFLYNEVEQAFINSRQK